MLPLRGRTRAFQSTPLTRGETFNPASISTSGTNFNPLPSHEGRHFMRRKKRRERDFNPLPSHEGRRRILVLADSSSSFQSTPLTRGETPAHTEYWRAAAISIHSPHTRGDGVYWYWLIAQAHFNPLPSHEGRPAAPPERPRISDFNPLPSHEGRREDAPDEPTQSHFNPLPSCEGRRVMGKRWKNMNEFQSTPLMRGET